MSGTHPSSSHPTLTRIEQLLNRANAHPINPSPSSSTGARRQSFAGTSSRSPILIRPPAGPGSPNHPPGWQPPAARSVSSTFVPHLVRGTIDREASGSQPTATSPARSPTRRRPTSVLLAGSPRRVPSASPSTAAAAAAALTAAATSFPQPAYLRQSAMRHLIRSDNVSQTPLPNRQRLDALVTPSSAPTPAPSSLWNRSDSVGRDSESDDEDTQPSVRTVQAPPQPLAQLPPEQVLPLPTRWSESDRCATLTVSPDGRDLTFHGPTGTADEAASARTNHPIPPACGIYYYEVDIISRGRMGHISIGFSRKTVKLARLPGWEGESWGYHGDDGRTFADQRSGTVYGPTFTTGDRIGCGIDFAQGNAFFTKNGRFIGYVFADLEGGPGKEIYPSVGLRSTDESVRANFGHEPFQFDILSHVQQRRNAAWVEIQQTELPPEWGTVGKPAEDGVEDRTRMNALILGYLTHHGYAGAARKFQMQCGRVGGDVAPMDVPEDTQARQRIYHAVLQGDLERALEETQAHYPAVLEREKGLMHFKLRCRKLGEMIIEAAEALQRRTARGRESHDMDDIAQGVLIAPETEEDLYLREDSMDVDDDEGGPYTNGNGGKTNGHTLKGKGKGKAEESEETKRLRALEYGKQLQAECLADPRAEVHELFRRTSLLWAYLNPREEGSPVAEYASQAARAELANELNQAILESQGKPAQPALERLYRHTEACIMTLGTLGVGAAAFADMEKEFIGRSEMDD